MASKDKKNKLSEPTKLIKSNILNGVGPVAELDIISYWRLLLFELFIYTTICMTGTGTVFCMALAWWIEISKH